MDRPTEKQLNVIWFIERNLRYHDIKFAGKTKKDAAEFIKKYMEQSKSARRQIRRAIAMDERNRRLQERADAKRISSLKSSEERYDDYIEHLSWNFVEMDGTDDWGGFGSRALARQFCPYDEWKSMGEP